MSIASSSSPSSRWSRGSKSNVGRLAVLAQRDEVVLAAGGHAVDDDVLDRGERRVGCLFRGASTACWAGLDPLAELLRLRDERGLLVLRRLRDPLAERVLLGAQLLERGDRGAAVGVGRERLVDACSADSPRASCERLTSSGFSRRKCGIDHPSSLVSGRHGRHPAARPRP